MFYSYTGSEHKNMLDRFSIHQINGLSSCCYLSKVSVAKNVALGFKDKTRYTPYVSPGSQISNIAINKGNINRQCLIYNILSIKDITLDSKQWKDNSDLRVKTPIS